MKKFNNSEFILHVCSIIVLSLLGRDLLYIYCSIVITLTLIDIKNKL